jgi:hypothetical protein
MSLSINDMLEIEEDLKKKQNSGSTILVVFINKNGTLEDRKFSNREDFKTFIEDCIEVWGRYDTIDNVAVFINNHRKELEITSKEIYDISIK